MQGTLLDAAARLTDGELLCRVRSLAGRERQATAELVAHLAELDVRRLHLGLGYASLFSYCTRALCLAEHAAYNRIEAARASRRFPLILGRLADGSLNLSTVRLLAPHLTPENHLNVLQQASGKSKREIEELVARLAPQPDVPSWVRRLPPARLHQTALTESAATPGRAVQAATPAHGASVTFTSPAVAPNTIGASAAGEADSPAGGPDAPGARVPAATGLGSSPGVGPAASTHVSAAAPLAHAGAAATAVGDAAHLQGLSAPPNGRRPLVAALSPGRYRVQFTVDQETHEDLRRAQDLLRREIPDGDPGAIFGRALKLLLEDLARKKLTAVSRARPGRTVVTRSRHVPAHVKRAVWLRDGGRCAFVARSGRRCRERAFLEFHHVEPYAIGGETSAANLSLRCRAHNVHEHERLFGRAGWPKPRCHPEGPMAAAHEAPRVWTASQSPGRRGA